MDFLKQNDCYVPLIIYVVFIGCLPLLVVGCGKQSNEKLAKSYFRMAFSELSDDGDSIASGKRALVHINNALAQEQKPEYYAFKATVLFKLGDLEQCDACYQKALALQPSTELEAEILNNSACLFAYQRKYERAKKIWLGLTTNALYQTPEVAFFNLGKLYVSEKNLLEAKAAFQKAVRIAPSYLDAHFYLGLVSHELGDDKEARNQTKTVLTLEPEHPGAHMLAAHLGTDVPGHVEE